MSDPLIVPAEIIYDSHDANLLNRYVQCLVGEPFQFQQLSYGNELHLHFGVLEQRFAIRTNLPYPRGVYQLWCRGSDVASTVSEDSAGATVVCAAAIATAQGYVLNIELSNKTTLTVTPVVDDIKDIADWEMYMPHQRVLHVGSGLVWSCVPSNVPVNELELLAPETFGAHPVSVG